MMTTYAINLNGEQVATMTADFAQASSPLMLDGDSTPYQVADARHRRQRAAEMLLSWAWRDGRAVCEMNQDGEPVGDLTVEEIAA